MFREWLKFHGGGGVVLERAGAVVENIKRQSIHCMIVLRIDC